LDAVRTRPLIALIDNSGPYSTAQATPPGDQLLGGHLATITSDLRDHDRSLAAFMQNGAQAADEGAQAV